MPRIRTRAGKGALLTNAEIDDMHRRGATAISDDYTAQVSDNRDTLLVSGETTISLPVASVILGLAETGDWRVTVKNVGENDVTVEAVGGDAIDGESEITLAPGAAVPLIAVSGGYVRAVPGTRTDAQNEADFFPNAHLPTGTRMLFQQTAAPTGWTKVTDSAFNNVALRLVTGTVGNGGANNFTTALNSARTSSASGTGNTSSAGAHTHTGTTDQTGGNANVELFTQNPTSVTASHSHSFTTGSSGAHTHGGPSHTHTTNLNVQYRDVILAERD